MRLQSIGSNSNITRNNNYQFEGRLKPETLFEIFTNNQILKNSSKRYPYVRSYNEAVQDILSLKKDPVIQKIKDFPKADFEKEMAEGINEVSPEIISRIKNIEGSNWRNPNLWDKEKLNAAEDVKQTVKDLLDKDGFLEINFKNETINKIVNKFFTPKKKGEADSFPKKLELTNTALLRLMTGKEFNTYGSSAQSEVVANVRKAFGFNVNDWKALHPEKREFLKQELSKTVAESYPGIEASSNKILDEYTKYPGGPSSQLKMDLINVFRNENSNLPKDSNQKLSLSIPAEKLEKIKLEMENMFGK